MLKRNVRGQNNGETGDTKTTKSLTGHNDPKRLVSVPNNMGVTHRVLENDRVGSRHSKGEQPSSKSSTLVVEVNLQQAILLAVQENDVEKVYELLNKQSGEQNIPVEICIMSLQTYLLQRAQQIGNDLMTVHIVHSQKDYKGKQEVLM